METDLDVTAPGEMKREMSKLLEKTALLVRFREIVDNVDGRWRLDTPETWVAVPAPGGLHLLSEDSFRRAMRASPGGRLYVVNVETMEIAHDESSTSVGRRDRDFLLETQGAWALVDFAILPSECEWIVVHSRESFMIVLGHEETILGLVEQKSLDDARGEFTRFAETWRDADTERLNACGQIDWEAAPGEVVWL